MKRVIDVDMEIRCKKATTAINRFFKKYPELDYWKETFENMAKNGIRFYREENGTENWAWALHFDFDEQFGWAYIAVIERA